MHLVMIPVPWVETTVLGVSVAKPLKDHLRKVYESWDCLKLSVVNVQKAQHKCLQKGVRSWGIPGDHSRKPLWWQDNGPLKMSMSLSPEPVNKLPCMTEGTLKT